MGCAVAERESYRSRSEVAYTELPVMMAPPKTFILGVSTRMENNDREKGIVKEDEKELEKANC